ncbi:MULTISPECIES: TetR/AcrR family transcriptional regulator [unclassified Mycobacterium]|uniref:TetR/AcrR family transcriptional regulator n=1 Tax=unclassified Mycobacterium TaxID=2642494 RepID=UPI0029C656AB|nr:MULTISPECIES: TetR/AcrR family transcriptional regulator [unclassified Mycobacterium]
MFSERVQSRADAKADTRQRVLAAADRLFREQGFAATTVRRIAAEASVSVGTVMGVGDKDGLLIAIVDHWIAAVHAARDRNARVPPLTKTEAAERLIATVEPFVAYFQSDRDLYREYAAVVARGRHRSRTFTELADELVADFERIFRAAGHANSAAAARTLYLAYIGVLRATSGGAFDESAAPGRFAEAVDLILGNGVPQ